MCVKGRIPVARQLNSQPRTSQTTKLCTPRKSSGTTLTYCNCCIIFSIYWLVCWYPVMLRFLTAERILAKYCIFLTASISGRLKHLKALEKMHLHLFFVIMIFIFSCYSSCLFMIKAIEVILLVHKSSLPFSCFSWLFADIQVILIRKV